MSDNALNPPDANIREAHTPAAIRSRLRSGPAQPYLHDFIYGAVDGLVTTFAVIFGVAGAGLAGGVVIVLGVANLAADGFSMAVSNYLATRADQELVERARRIEEQHIDVYADGEREEVRQIFAAKGISGRQLEEIVAIVTSSRQRWIDTMIQEEYGLRLNTISPIKAAAVTFGAFTSLGVLPLISFVVEYLLPQTKMNPYLLSSIITAIALFLIGATKARFVRQRWYWGGTETLLVGGAAAALAYCVGGLLRGVVS